MEQVSNIAVVSVVVVALGLTALALRRAYQTLHVPLTQFARSKTEGSVYPVDNLGTVLRVELGEFRCSSMLFDESECKEFIRRAQSLYSQSLLSLVRTEWAH